MMVSGNAAKASLAQVKGSCRAGTLPSRNSSASTKSASAHDYHNKAWYGMCECERKAAKLDTAIADCQKALTYDAKDPFAHYTLGLAFMTKAVNTGSVGERLL